MNRNIANRCSGSQIGIDFHTADDGEDNLCGDCRKAMQEADAKQEQAWQLFCGKEDDHFEHFFPSVMQVEMCGEAEIFLVRLVPDENGDYFGWYHSHHPENVAFKGEVSMIYRRDFLVEMCFPYGTAPEERRGLGKILRLRVKEVRRAKKGEAISRGEVVVSRVPS